jgi:hypothetical protein
MGEGGGGGKTDDCPCPPLTPPPPPPPPPPPVYAAQLARQWLSLVVHLVSLVGLHGDTACDGLLCSTALLTSAAWSRQLPAPQTLWYPACYCC